jgi:hypothetical protein
LQSLRVRDNNSDCRTYLPPDPTVARNAIRKLDRAARRLTK